MAESSLEAWQFLMPGLEGFREARLTSSASAFVAGFREARLRRAHAGRELAILSDAPALRARDRLRRRDRGHLGPSVRHRHRQRTRSRSWESSRRHPCGPLPTLNKITANLATIRTGRAGLDIVSRISEELAVGGTHEEQPLSDERYAGDIAVRRVSFRYPDAALPVLDERHR